MVVTADISSSSDSNILQGSSPCPVDHQVVDLVLISSIEGGGGGGGKHQVRLWISPAWTVAFDNSKLLVLFAIFVSSFTMSPIIISTEEHNAMDN